MPIVLIIELLLFLVSGMIITLASISFNPVTRVKTSQTAGFWLGLILCGGFWLLCWSLNHVSVLWPMIPIAFTGSYSAGSIAGWLSAFLVSDMPKEGKSRDPADDYPAWL